VENVPEEARVGRGGGLNSVVPGGTHHDFFLTRQFLPGYFHSRLTALRLTSVEKRTSASLAGQRPVTSFLLLKCMVSIYKMSSN
jgi:hypothetical protein